MLKYRKLFVLINSWSFHCALDSDSAHGVDSPRHKVTGRCAELTNQNRITLSSVATTLIYKIMGGEGRELADINKGTAEDWEQGDKTDRAEVSRQGEQHFCASWSVRPVFGSRHRLSWLRFVVFTSMKIPIQFYVRPRPLPYTAFRMNYSLNLYVIFKEFTPHLKVNTTLLHHQSQVINAVQGNDSCLHWKWY
jgi:hypothetical protein